MAKTQTEKTAEAVKAGADPSTGEIKGEASQRQLLEPNSGGSGTNDSTAVVEQPKPGQLSAEQLSMMRKNAGKQKFTVKELVIPQVKIVQANTYAKKSNPEYVEGAEEGDLIDTMSLVPLKGSQKIVVVRFATTYMEAKPEMGPIVKIWGTDSRGYDDAEGGDVGVRITRDGNEIRATASYHCLLLNADGSSLPCMLYAGGTAWKEARRLNTLLGSFELMSEDGPYIAPPYARIYTVTTVPMQNDKNTWMSWKFGVGPLTLMQRFGTALYQKAVDFEESVDKGIVKVHGPIEDDREMARSGQGSHAPSRDQGVGPRRDDGPPIEAYANEMGGDPQKINF